MKRFKIAISTMALLGGLACSGETDPGADSGESSSETDADETESGTDEPMLLDCGNGSIEDGEQCDGLELGGVSCTDVDSAYTAGDLACGATCTFDETGCALQPGASQIRINELTSDSVAQGPFATDFADAIEIHNSGEGVADISGYQLSDDPMLPIDRTYVFPDGTTLDPGDYIVLTAVDPDTMEGDYPFGISDSSEETITLADANGGEVDSVLIDGFKAVVSYCRVPDGSGPWELCEQTFGEANQLATTACGNGVIEADEACDSGDLDDTDCAGVGLGFTAGALACSGQCLFDARACTTDSDVVINELEAITDDLEIYNGGDTAVDLSGWILTDDIIRADYNAQDDLAELVFAPGTMLGPGEYLVIPVGVGAGQHPFGLGTQGDTVALVSPSPLTVIDQVTYQSGEATVSYCRQPNGPGGTWTDGCGPSIGGPN